jgi:hypothetical protein
VFGSHSRIERLQEKFVKYALRRLGWDASSDLPPYRSRCSLLNLDKLQTRREISRDLGLRVPSYPTRRYEFCQIDYHHTNYGAFASINAALHGFNEIADLSISICCGVDENGGNIEKIFEKSQRKISNIKKARKKSLECV